MTAKEQFDVMDELDRDIIYVLGHVQGLVNRGLVNTTEPCAGLTAEGMRLFEVVKAAGWVPTPERLALVVALVRREEGVADAAG